MPLVDVVDDTFVRAAPEVVRALTRGHWERWLDGLVLTVAQERGAEGVRWRAEAVTGRGRHAVRWAGTAEVWLEAGWGGTVVHLYVRLDPEVRAVPEPPEQPSPPGPPTEWQRRRVARHARRLPARLRPAWKRGLVHAVEDDPRLRSSEPTGPQEAPR